MRYLITCGGFFARANAHFERISGIQILGPFWQDPGQMEHGGPRAIGTWGTQGNWNMGGGAMLASGTFPWGDGGRGHVAFWDVFLWDPRPLELLFGDFRL